jgi:hypothetical protein
MSDFEEYEDDFDQAGDDFDQAGFDPMSSKPYTVFDPDEDERSLLRLPGPGPGPPPLRSRGQINFSGRYSAVGAPTFSGSNVSRRPSTHMSGSTLRSSFNPSTAYLHSHKTYPPADSSTLLPDAIALLTEAQLHHNPHFRKLLQKYDHVCEILIGRDLAESRAAQSNIGVPDIYQGV